MNTNNAVVATAAIVVVGRWAQEKPLSVRVVVGGMFLALGLSLMSEANPKLASRFALLILVVAMFMYIPGIAYKAGLINSDPTASIRIPKKARGSTGGRKK